MEADGFLSESQRRFLPRLVSLVEAPGMTDLASMTNLLKGRKAEQGITAYLSRGQTCKSPFHIAINWGFYSTRRFAGELSLFEHFQQVRHQLLLA